MSAEYMHIGIPITNKKPGMTYNEGAKFWVSNVDDYDFLQEVTRQETMRMLYVAIDQLPPQTRNVILLNLEGKTNPEVAEELGISVNTVKCLKKSAYETLRGTLSKNYFVIFTKKTSGSQPDIWVSQDDASDIRYATLKSSYT